MQTRSQKKRRTKEVMQAVPNLVRGLKNHIISAAMECSDRMCLALDPSNVANRYLACGEHYHKCCQTPVARMVKDSSSSCPRGATGLRNASQRRENNEDALEILSKELEFFMRGALQHNNPIVISKSVLWNTMRYDRYQVLQTVEKLFSRGGAFKLERQFYSQKANKCESNVSVHNPSYFT